MSIEIEEGETVALIGANGAGKSSILRAITGLRKLRTGEVTFDGKRIDGTAPMPSSSSASPWCPKAGGSFR